MKSGLPLVNKVLGAESFSDQPGCLWCLQHNGCRTKGTCLVNRSLAASRKLWYSIKLVCDFLCLTCISALLVSIFCKSCMITAGALIRKCLQLLFPPLIWVHHSHRYHNPFPQLLQINKHFPSDIINSTPLFSNLAYGRKNC